jgi:hypothetical protein
MGLKKTVIKVNAFLKGIVILSRPHIYLGWLRKPAGFFSNTLALTKWISKQDKSGIMDDFYTSRREYGRRFTLYQYISDQFSLETQPFDYFEFGVAAGHSFRWWVNNSKNSECRFFGFDTFEGLPEDWGTFNKNDMSADVPQVDDSRVTFCKGLFQDSVPVFLKTYSATDGRRRVIHLDADLFSATLFALTSMAPFLKKGDILLFDEFNVPNHEFLAFRIFTESYYIRTRLLGAVNNYLQVALIVE